MSGDELVNRIRQMIRLSKEQAEAHQQRVKGVRTVTLMPQGKPSKVKEPRTSRMNKTETQYAQILEYRKRAGEITDWKFEAIKLRLATNTTYTPDFLVVPVPPYEHLEFHETKGHWRPQARVKIKVAAETFPYFKFRAVKKVPQKDGGGWREEHFR